MKDNTEKQFSYELNIEKATSAIKKNDYAAALDYIKHAVVENINFPEVHNLLGIIAELNKDLRMAGKHYRAAYALDPTYKPAINNLERITTFLYNADIVEPDYGNMPEPKEEVLSYIITYDQKHIGHLKKAN